MTKNIGIFLIALFLGIFLFSCSKDDVGPEDPFTVVGDTQAYPYQLEVIYFVPLDVTPNPLYEERLSALLLNFQLFVCKWMEHWGYGYRSFGPPLRSDGMVDIVTVYGKDPKSGYPYDPASSTVPKIQQEVAEHYAANGLTWRNGADRAVGERHVLVITASNAANGVGSNAPFYGFGRWAFALDYPGMSQEEFPRNSSAYVGGLMHELGHGLNLPHVGPSFSQKNSSRFGMTLMGAGNGTYGKTPTFFHHASAATLSTCELSALTPGTFYDNATASIAQPEVVIDGGECTVNGTFTSNKTVTDVVVRFYNASEEFLGGSSGYTSVAYVAESMDNTSYEVTFPVNDLRTIPGGSYRMGVSILTGNGLARSVSSEAVYKLVNQGGSYTMSTSYISRAGWSVTASHQLPTGSANPGDVNAPGSLVDGNANTCLTLVKPGMTYGGVSVGAEDTVWVKIDMGKATAFNTVLLDFRLYQTHVAWRAQKVSFYRSDDGQNFTLIKQAELETANPAKIQNIIELGTSVTCRYLKMTYDQWETVSGDAGGAMMFSELSLQNK